MLPIIDVLTGSASLLGALAALALVAITWRYTIATWEMVNEMRAARATQLLPKLIVKLNHVGCAQSFPQIHNVGPGPALEVELQMWFEPGDRPRPIRRSVLVPGEHIELFGTNEEDERQRTFMTEKMTERYGHIRLVGTCRDALNELHPVDVTYDIREEWARLKESNPILETTELQDVARALKPLEDIGRTLRDISSRIPRPEPTHKRLETPTLQESQRIGSN